MMLKATIGLLLALTSLVSCQEKSPTLLTGLAENTMGRWYSSQQVEQGQSVFAEHCAVCHGDKAQGNTDNWRQRLATGFFPPPPLDGTAHAWHHPLSVLLQTIEQGGVALGGVMPGFSSVLSDADKLAAIAYFQQFWSDEIYSQWLLMGGVQ
jgi:mono/diheme cytochrome c family protein